MIKKLILIAALASAISPLAHATLNFQLQNASPTGAPGDLLTFTVTLTNPSSTDTVFLNGTGTTSSSPFLTINDALFSANAPFFLDPLEVSAAFDIFTVSIDPAAPDGPLVGSIFTILGGADSNAIDDVVDISFDVNVQSATVAPEPGTIGGVFIGLLAIGWTALRRRASPEKALPSKFTFRNERRELPVE